MANKKITDLPSISGPLKGTDLWEVAIDDGGSFSSHQTTGDELKSLLSLGGDQYTFVKADGNSSIENGKQFETGYNTAIDKLINTETPQTLILAPGTYMLNQNFNIVDGLSIVSLTGERDVRIDMDGYIFMIKDGNTKLKGLSLTASGNVFYDGYGTYNCIIDNCSINAFIALNQNIPFYGIIKNSELSGIHAPFSGILKNISYCGIVYTDSDTGFGLFLMPYLDGVNLADSFYCNDVYDIIFEPTILNCNGRFFDQVNPSTIITNGTFKNITNFSMSLCKISGDTLLENCVGNTRVFEEIKFSGYAGFVNLKVINCHQKDNDGGFFIYSNKQTYSSINIEFRDCTAYGNAFNFHYFDTTFDLYNVSVENCVTTETSSHNFGHIIESDAYITINDITFKDCKANAVDCFNTSTNMNGDLTVVNQNFINCTAGDQSFLYFNGQQVFTANIGNTTFENCTAGSSSFISLEEVFESLINDNTIKNCTGIDRCFISAFVSSGTLVLNNNKEVYIDNCKAGERSFFYVESSSGSTANLNGSGKISNCTATDFSFCSAYDAIGFGNHSITINMSMENCTAQNFSFGSINNTFGSCYIDHGTGNKYTNCIAGSASFMGYLDSLLRNCRAQADSFGTVWMNTNMYGGASGTFENCYGTQYCFGGSSDVYLNYPTAFGTFKYCTGEYGCFGSYNFDSGSSSDYTTAAGAFLWCAGSEPFGTLFSGSLQGGGQLFWSKTNGAVGNVSWANEKYNN
jgi:hypothetical protein